MIELLAPLILAQAATTISFAENPGSKTIQQDGVEVTLQPVPGEDGAVKALVSVRVPNYQTIIFEDTQAQPWVPRRVIIGKFAQSDPVPGALIQSFTGGAHCCTVITAVAPYAGRLKPVPVGTVDGDLLDAFPTDIDGDGNADFDLADERFNYAFSSYAGSWAPSRFFNIYKGQLVEVTVEPGFRARFEAFAKDAWKACADRTNTDRNGACAGYVAASARLGRYQEALREAEALAYNGPDARYPDGCKVEAEECADTQKIVHRSFGAAIRWFLGASGYLE